MKVTTRMDSYSKSTYKKGELNGPFEIYYENGQLSEKCTYKNGFKKDLMKVTTRMDS